jgi:putative SOS response-associated peptidase YedK
MCGRYTLARGEEILEIVPNITIKEDLRTNIPLWSGRWNIAPSQDIVVVANREEEGKLVAEPMRWGLVPSWAKDPSIGNKMINARAETLPTKPAFRKALERRRCIIPADGFYEWKKPLADAPAKGRGAGGGGKQPLYIHMKDGHPFAFAGLWETWRDEKGELLKTCTIITTGPNRLMATIHDRMPVILPREAILDWLDPKPRDPEQMAAWLKPYPAEEMEAIPVSRAVNSPKNEGPELIQCIASPADDDSNEQSRGSAAPPKARNSSRRRKGDDQQGSLF